jgi:GntR family transcriptional regulator, transcriptional repressor for pyruvate dehydrogenase complex
VHWAYDQTMDEKALRGGRVEVHPAYALVVEHIRRAIRLGEYKPGDKMPPERQHAAQLGVSRVTLREAIRVLQGEGYVETRRGSAGGVIVLGPQESVELRRQRLRARLDELLDIQEFRRVNERLAAECAAARATEEDLEALEASIESMAASETLGDFRQTDSAFHLGIAASTGSPLLMAAIEEARAAMFDSTDALDYDLMLAANVKVHRKILDAIRARDTARAGRAMQAHVNATTRELKELLGA